MASTTTRAPSRNCWRITPRRYGRGARRGRLIRGNVASSTSANTVTESRRAATGAAACARRRQPGQHRLRPCDRGARRRASRPVATGRSGAGMPGRRHQQRLGHGGEHDGEDAVVGVGGDAAAGLVHVGPHRAPQPVDEPAEEAFGRRAEGVEPPQHGAQQLRRIGVADHVAVEPGDRLEVALAAARIARCPAGPGDRRPLGGIGRPAVGEVGERTDVAGSPSSAGTAARSSSARAAARSGNGTAMCPRRSSSARTPSIPVSIQPRNPPRGHEDPVTIPWRQAQEHKHGAGESPA